MVTMTRSFRSQILHHAKCKSGALKQGAEFGAQQGGAVKAARRSALDVNQSRSARIMANLKDS